MKKLIYFLLGAVVMVAGTVYAAPSLTYLRTVLPEVTDAFDLGTTTRKWRSLYLTGSDGCLELTSGLVTSTGTNCGTGSGGGSGGGTFSTTTSTHSGRLINYPNNNTDIVTVGGTATTTSATEVYFDPNTENYKIGSSNTASTTIMGLLNFPTLSQGFSYIGSRGRLSSIASSSVQLSWFNNDAGFESGITAGDGLTRTVNDFDCDTASGSVFGCLTSTDWNTFNGKQDTITAGDALTLTGTDIDFDGGTAPGGSLGGTWASPTIDDLFILNTGDVGTGSYTFPFASTTAFSSEYASSTLQSIGTLTFGGVTGSAWSTFCTSITGGAGLCDGSDDGAGGGLSAYDAWTHPSPGVSATTSEIQASAISAANSINGGVAVYAEQSHANGYSIFAPDGQSYFAENLGIASATPGTLLSIGETGGINFQLGTSTFGSNTKGINLIGGGCFAIGGVCISGSGGSGITAYDAWTHATVGLSATTSALAVSTSTNPSLYPITAFSSTLPQLSLSAGGGLAQWTMRNAGGNLYFATTTVAGTATSTPAGFALFNSGRGLAVATSSMGAYTGLAVDGTGVWTGLTASAGTPSSICQNASTKEITVNAALTCTVSSRLQKNDEGYLTDSYLDTFMKLQPVQFAYKDQPDRSRWGFYAEDVSRINRKLGDGYDAKGNPQSLDQNAILALTVKAVQELADFKGATRSAEENYQWIIIGLMALWIIRLEFKKHG